MSKRIVLFLVFNIFIISIIGVAFAKTPLSERYPGPWEHGFNVGISKALVKNKIRGCGEYKYRPSSKDHNEYLVRCTRDGINWNSYIVWVGIDEVMGPYKTDSSLD